MKRFIMILLAISMLFSLAGCSEPTDETGSSETTAPTGAEVVINTGTPSLSVDGNARVYYQIFVGSFSDSNGDGIGDLRGIINRFDYLNDGDDSSGKSLGVEGIWLSPIFQSPSYHKYDVTDYYTIDPDFGTMEDLKELIDLCHSRNVQIILDLAINHTSRSNAWFTSFVSAHKEGDTESEYFDFYTYADSPLASRTFSKIQGTSEYYECNFSGDMPELNFDNDAVRQTVLDIARYYLELGVDGFRFDAAKYIYFSEEAKNAEFWQWYLGELRAIKRDIYTVAEVWDGDGVTYPYFAATNCFNFSMSQTSGRIAQAAKGGNVNAFTSYIYNYLNAIHAENPDAMLVTFIANHDMDRAAGFLTIAGNYAAVAANLSILTPGSPFIYYGEEIGMLGSRGSANTDANRRLAMLWGDGDTVKNPVGANYSAALTNGTVADQLSDESSLYNHYKNLIAIRKANPEIAYGTFTPITGTGSKVGGFLSTYEGSTVAVLHNTTAEAVEVDLSKLSDVSVTQIIAYAGVGNATLDGNTLTISGQTSVVLR